MIGHHRMCSYGNDRNGAKCGFLPDPFGQREAVLCTQLHIKEDNMRRLGFQSGKTLSEIFGGERMEAFCFEPVTKQLAIGLIVFDD